jgi:hypothetical protein
MANKTAGSGGMGDVLSTQRDGLPGGAPGGGGSGEVEVLVPVFHTPKSTLAWYPAVEEMAATEVARAQAISQLVPALMIARQQVVFAKLMMVQVLVLAALLEVTPPDLRRLRLLTHTIVHDPDKQTCCMSLGWNPLWASPPLQPCGVACRNTATNVDEQH